MARDRLAGVKSVVRGPIETGNNVVFWSDIESLVGEFTDTQIAGILNNDFRHFADSTTGAMFGLTSDQLAMIKKDVGEKQTATDDSFVWQGWFDQWHRDLVAQNPQQEAIKSAWNRVLTKDGQGKDDAVIPCFDPNPPEDGIETTRYQQAGYVMNEWNHLSQQIAVNDPGLVGGLTPPWNDPYDGEFVDDPQRVSDAWQALSGGGRRFGIVVAADVTAVREQQDRDVALNTVVSTNNDGNAAAQVSHANNETPAQILAAGNAWS